MIKVKFGRGLLVGLLALVAALVVFICWRPARHLVLYDQPGIYHVSQFIDGDTLVVDMSGVKEHIRFIGVDTPETHDPRKSVQCFGWAAANFTKKLIGKQPIRLVADPQDTNRDRYGRLLRYIYLPNGLLVNEELIKKGYGFAYTSFPFTKKAAFRKDQSVAIKQKVGLWKACQPQKDKYGGYSSNPAS